MHYYKQRTGEALREVERYRETVKKYPNPPAPNITQFHEPAAG
jgi:hypothetical protein